MLIHVIAGSLGLAAGAVALCALKGARLHRLSGTIFVYVTLVASATGAVVAAQIPKAISMIAGSLTFYLVATALLTVRRRIPAVQWIDAAAMVFAVSIGFLGIKFGLDGLMSKNGKLDGLPPAPGFVFGGVALLAALGDLRVMLASGISETQRIARHLWRMCFALFIAAGSFFLGQARVFPKPMRIVPLLATPVLSVLVVMLYWLVRVGLLGKTFSRTSPAPAPAAREAAAVV